MRSRSWPWLEAKVYGLLNSYTVGPDGTPIPTTRIGWMLNPPRRQQQSGDGPAE